MEAVSIIPGNGGLVEVFNQYLDRISINDHPEVTSLRKKAISLFQDSGFPTRDLEEWKSTDLSEPLSREYLWHPIAFEETPDIDRIFRCEIHNFETYLFTQYNGWYVYKNAPLTRMANGVVIGSLSAAFGEFPEIIRAHYGRYADPSINGLVALNTAFAQDGFFIFVPDGVVIDKPVQIVNIINRAENIMVQPRNLVVAGKNSALTLVHCDDSIMHKYSFINTVTEIQLDEGANVEYYKLQNKDDNAAVITSTFINQHAGSNVHTNTISLNGGLIRNDTRVVLDGEKSRAGIYGLYLMDRRQHIDNQVYVHHKTPDTVSYEMFKGIIDDDAGAVFNGHILVDRDAQKTEAYQTNRNILLTDTAKVSTKPFLEIYADDVKCSHGATVGQLDPEALFYLKSRGICDRNARMLLMYAFAAEVAGKINISVLRERIEAMIQKRLRGELSICDQCVLHCKEGEAIHFEIDMSKI